MKYIARSSTALVAAAIFVASGAFAQQAPPVQPSFRNGGIVVDRIKIYSDADLRAKFRDLARSLSPLLGVDPAKVLEGLFTFQGHTADRSSSAISATTTPLPSIQEVAQQNFPVAKDPVTGNQTTTNLGEQKAYVPPTTTPAGTQTAPTGVAQNALDRISEYTQLFYETTNLQVLLNRAISDTLGSNGRDARVPIILGIPVSVVATPRTQGGLAQVWVTISRKNPEKGDAETVNVITQIPQERTYNVSTITNDVSSVGLGAVTTFINLGFSQTNQRERLYLVKTYDTISLSAFDPKDNKLGAEFGWQLRPVLGNKSVTPGKRNLMVALSLPSGKSQTLVVKVTTQWFKYDKKTGSVKEPIDLEPQYAYETELNIDTASLSPSLHKELLNTGANGAIEARLHGHSFTPDLPYYSGGRRVAVSSSVDDMSSVQLTLMKDDLLTNDFKVGNIFGGLIPLQVGLEEWYLARPPAETLNRATAEAWEESDDSYQARIKIPGNWTCLSGRAIVQIGDYFAGFAQKDKPSFTYDPKLECTISSYIKVPTKSIVTNRTVILSVPFRGVGSATLPLGATNVVNARASSDGYPAVRAETTLKVYNGFAVTSVVKSGKGEGKFGAYTVYTMTGRGLRNLEVQVPDIGDITIVKNPEKVGATGKEEQTATPRTITLQRGSEAGEDDRARYFQKMFNVLNTGDSQSSSGDVYLVPIADDALKFTRFFVVSKKISPVGEACESDDAPCPMPRTFSRVIGVEPPKAPAAPVTITAIDSVLLNHVGAVKIHGEGFARVKKVVVGKDEVQFFGPETVDTVDAQGKPKKEAIWYLVLPTSLSKTVGVRHVVFVLDDGTIVTSSFNVKAS